MLYFLALRTSLEVEMDSVLEDTELIALQGCLLALVIHICQGPERVIAPLALHVHVAGAKTHADRDVIEVLDCESVQLAVLGHNFTNYLRLVVAIAFNVGLECLLGNQFVRERLHFDLDLEGIALQCHQLVLEIVRMVIDRDPYGHGVVLKLAVHLIHV